MMNAFPVSTLLFLIIGTGICDENVNIGNTDNPGEVNHVESSEDYNDSQSQTESRQESKNDENYEDNSIDDVWPMFRNIRTPSGFFGVRGKKDDEPINFSDLENEYYSNEIKRDPSQEFFGVRGKKYVNFKETPADIVGIYGNEIPNLGDFQSELYRQFLMENDRYETRGKKSVENTDYPEYEKRVPMGFQGVRGKKAEYPDFLGIQTKRVPIAGFFGMRGKKQPTSSKFFGVRKKPYMSYAKFVGVRGKKVPETNIKKLNVDSGDLSNGLRSAKLVNSDTQDKRIGFVGMRGRK